MDASTITRAIVLAIWLMVDSRFVAAAESPNSGESAAREGVLAKLKSRGVNVFGLTIDADQGGPAINLGTGERGGEANNADDDSLALVSLLPEVERISIFKGTFTKQGLAKLAGLPKLRAIQVYAPAVEPGVFAALEQFPRLHSLQIGDYPVTDAILAHVGTIRGLKELEITNPRAITPAAFAAFLDGLDGLESLTLIEDEIDDACLERIGRMTNMTRLWTGSKKLTSGAWPHLAGLTKMTDLNLQGTTLDDKGAGAIAGMPDLRRLILSGTRITDLGMASLAGLSKLEELGLEGTAVGNAGMVHLRKLTELENLYVGRTTVTVAGLAAVPRKDRMVMMRTGQESLSPKQFDEIFSLFPQTQIFDPSGYWTPERIKASMHELGRTTPVPQPY